MPAELAPSIVDLAVPLDRVHLLPGNPRRGDIKAIAGSLARFGQVKPIVANQDGTIIAGNHTYEAARQLGWDEIAVSWVDLPVEEAMGLALADNRTGDLGSYDDEALVQMLSYVADIPELLAATAYSAEDIERLVHGIDYVPETLTDPDAVPEVPEQAASKRGDVWLLGPHRVMCGDATSKDDLAKLLGSDEPNLLLTDPPYGVAIGEKNRALDALDKGSSGRVTTDLSGDEGIAEVEALWRASFPALRSVLPAGCPYYVFGPQGGELGLLLLLLREGGLATRHILIWVKNRASFSMGRLDYEYAHEPICYGWTPGHAHPWYSTETQNSIIEVDRPQASSLHPTMKPVELFVRLIDNSTRRGGVVLDPFGGSGTTVMACHQTGRVARVLELDEHYVDVICRRYQEATGAVPVLDSSGEPHDFTA